MFKNIILLKGYTFSPKISLVLLGLVLAGVCFALGIWQVGRGQEKEALFQRSLQMMQLPPLLLNDDSGSETQFREVFAKGQYLNEQGFLLDNAVLEGKAGYDVITPFKLSGRDQIVLVNRGWISTGADRRILPNIKTYLGEHVIRGHLNTPKSKPPFTSVTLDANQPVRLFIDIEKIQKNFAYPVLPLVLELIPDSEQGLIQSPYVPDNSKVSMHKAYAIQWFLFASFALLLVFYGSFKKIERQENT